MEPFSELCSVIVFLAFVEDSLNHNINVSNTKNLFLKKKKIKFCGFHLEKEIYPC